MGAVSLFLPPQTDFNFPEFLDFFVAGKQVDLLFSPFPDQVEGSRGEWVVKKTFRHAYKEPGFPIFFLVLFSPYSNFARISGGFENTSRNKTSFFYAPHFLGKHQRENENSNLFFFSSRAR